MKRRNLKNRKLLEKKFLKEIGIIENVPLWTDSEKQELQNRILDTFLKDIKPKKKKKTNLRLEIFP